MANSDDDSASERRQGPYRVLSFVVSIVVGVFLHWVVSVMGLFAGMFLVGKTSSMLLNCLFGFYIPCFVSGAIIQATTGVRSPYQVAPLSALIAIVFWIFAFSPENRADPKAYLTLAGVPMSLLGAIACRRTNSHSSARKPGQATQ